MSFGSLRSHDLFDDAPAIPREAPRAPTAAAWAVMSEAERQQAEQRLNESVSEEEIEEREAMSEGDSHLDAKVVARDTLRAYFNRIGRSIYVGADIKVYYPGEKGFTPDLIAVLDVEPKRRRSWMVSHEGRGVDLALEVHDQGSWRKDFVDNVARYAELGIREYFILDINRQHLRGYRLPSANHRVYVPIQPDKGRYRSEVLGLDLLVEGEQVCFLHGTARLLGFEQLLAQEQVRAEAEQVRAEAEQARAEAEQARADQATTRVRAMLFDFLTLRGLAISDVQAARIREADLPLLERWAARVVTGSSAEEILVDD